MILVVAEVRDDGVTLGSLEAVAAAREFGGPVTAVVPGADVGPAVEELRRAELTDVIALEHEALARYTADGFVQALASFIVETAPAWVVFPHTYQTRDFAPRLAARLGRVLVTDCTAVASGSTGVVLTRLMFRGKVVAEVAIDGPAPYLVTVQVGAFHADAARAGAAGAAVRRVAATVDPALIRQRPERPFREAEQEVDLTRAERIVAAGRGIRSREQLAVVEALAAALGAELAASRPICDAGWLPMDRQVGSSGQTVAPRLYLAVGVSGAIQHVVGMRGARTVVAINDDPDAPIFDVADYGLVGDLFEIVPEIVKALR